VASTCSPKGKRRSLSAVGKLAAAGAAMFVLPTLAVVTYFAAHGELGTFVEANFTANARHATSREWYRVSGSSLDWFRATGVLWLVSALGWLAPVPDVAERRLRFRWLALLGCWVGVALVECFATFKFYEYYFLSTVPPACIAVGLATHFLKIAERGRYAAVACAIVIALAPIAEAAKVLYRPWARERARYGADPQVHLATVLQSHLSLGDRIFVLNGEPIWNSPLPTKFVLPPFLLDDHFNRVANVDYRAEFGRILASAPRCIVNRNNGNPRISEFKGLLGAEYVAEQVLPDTEILCRPLS
jgi:hypothetical protein